MAERTTDASGNLASSAPGEGADGSPGLPEHIATEPAHGGDLAGTPRPPLDHDHAIADITALQAALDDRATVGDLAGHADDEVSVHGIPDTQNLQRRHISEVIDMGSVPDFFEPIQELYITDTLDGLNSRVDDIDTDGGNAGGGAGATFAVPIHIDIQHKTRGSAHGFTATGKIWEAVEGDDIYGEMGMYEASIVIARRGAYSGLFEGGVTIEAGKQARGFGMALFIGEANTLASYNMLSDQWNLTGARGIWLASVGANPPGTAMFVEGTFENGIHFQYGDQGKFLLVSQQALADNPFFRINGLGVIEWGLPGGMELNLYNGGSGFLKTDDNMIVAGMMAFGLLRNLSAGNEFVSATAGANGAPPAQVAGYFLVYDSAGVGRMVPYYAAP